MATKKAAGTLSKAIESLTGTEINQIHERNSMVLRKLSAAAKSALLERATLIMWSPESKRVYAISSLHSDLSWVLTEDTLKGNQPLGIVTLADERITFDPLVDDLPRGLTMGSLKKQLDKCIKAEEVEIEEEVERLEPKRIGISEGEKSLQNNIQVIADDICSRISPPVTRKKREEVEKAIAAIYLPRMKARVSRGPVTKEWHGRMVRELINKLNRQFDAMTPKGWSEASKEERTLMMLTKAERKLYDRAKAAGSINPLREAFTHTHEQWKKRNPEKAARMKKATV